MGTIMDEQAFECRIGAKIANRAICNIPKELIVPFVTHSKTLENLPSPGRLSPARTPASGRTPNVGVDLVWSNPGSSYLQEPRPAGQMRLEPGSRLRFGLSSRSGSFEPWSVQSIGEFEIALDHWSMSNLTAATTFVIENLEGGAEIVKVAPRRLRVVVPFEISRVFIPSRSGLLELKVFGAPPNLLEAEAVSETSTLLPIELDETSKYFLVLVALCEPRLRGSSMAAVPSVQEVVERLRAIDGFENANRSSINYHIDYLRERKLPVEQWAMYSDGGRMHSKREALVSFALRYDLVTNQHLSLLPARRHARSRLGAIPVK
ncbi:hypothetical protein JYK22_02075, partial [Nonomuraea sp. RK-328]|nr:hypothetical protein [Nonomuraea sp. RK-328]